MLSVAIASEQDEYDAEVYRLLLEQLLGTSVEKWRSDMRFGGDGRVFSLAEPFLRRAADAGVRHAVLAVDNDGGSRRRLEHDPSHDIAAQAADVDDGCRVCRLEQAVPKLWSTSGGMYAVVVPVQALETWLLCLRGDALDPSPEQIYHRRVLKKRFFGAPYPSLEGRIARARELLASKPVIETLSARPSFQRFAAQVRAWGEGSVSGARLLPGSP